MASAAELVAMCVRTQVRSAEVSARRAATSNDEHARVVGADEITLGRLPAVESGIERNPAVRRQVGLGPAVPIPIVVRELRLNGAVRRANEATRNPRCPAQRTKDKAKF